MTQEKLERCRYLLVGETVSRMWDGVAEVGKHFSEKGIRVERVEAHVDYDAAVWVCFAWHPSQRGTLLECVERMDWPRADWEELLGMGLSDPRTVYSLSRG